MNDEIENTDPIEVEIEETASAEPEVVVEKTDDKPKEPNVAAETEVKADDTAEALAELRAQLDREKQARLAAEREAHNAQTTAFQARNEVQDSNLSMITGAIEMMKQNTASLKSAYRDAMANQDFDAAADVQVQMSENAARLLQLEQGKSALESAPKQEAPRHVSSDPVEMLASQLSSRSAAWVRAHPEYASDPKQYQKMLAAHNLAVADGVDVDTDDYFNAIEDTLRIRRADPAVVETPARRAAPPAAPVSRGPGGGGSANPNRVRLSADEVEMASMMGMTPQEYAKNKLALQKSGRMN